MDASREEVGTRVRKVRGALTQEEFGQRLGFSRSYLADIERGRSFPSVPFLQALAVHYGTSINWLLTGHESVRETAAPSQYKTLSLQATSEDESKFAAMLESLWHLFAAADLDTRGWLKVQLRRAVPELAEADTVEASDRARRSTPTQGSPLPARFRTPLESAVLQSAVAESSELEPPLPSKRITQVAIVVRDIDKAAQAYSEIFGLPVPQIIETDHADKTNVRYQGAPTPGRAKLAFFHMESLTLELIEPIDGPSTWQEFLDTHGEGIHHIAFQVKGMDRVLSRLQAANIPVLQRGDFAGGRYAYVDGTQAGLGAIIELLESFR